MDAKTLYLKLLAARQAEDNAVAEMATAKKNPLSAGYEAAFKALQKARAKRSRAEAAYAKAYA